MSVNRFTPAGRREIRRREEALANARAQGLTQSANFSAPQQNSANFAASTPAPTNNGASAFGGFSGNSFPPQPAAPNNTFGNPAASFPAPAFGANNQGTAFSPHPPSSTGFNFTSGGANANPFAQSTPNAPATNGDTATPAFGGAASMFGNNPQQNNQQFQQQSNPFGGLGQNNTTSSASPGGMFGTASSTPSGGMSMYDTTSTSASGGMFATSSSGMFGTPSSTPKGGMFGTTGGASNTMGIPAPTSKPFTFGAPTTSTQNTASTPATSSLFNFGAAAQPATPAQNGLFSGFAQKAETPQQPAAAPPNMFGGFAQKKEAAPETPQPQNNMFGAFGTGAQATPNVTAPAPAFQFGASAPQAENGATPAAPSANHFGTGFATSSAGTPASAPASNPFANLPTTSSTPSKPFAGFGATSQTPQAQANAPAASNNLFSSLKRPEDSSSIAAETPKSNPFAALSKPATPAASSTGFQFGTTQNRDAASGNAEKSSGAATLKAPEAPKSSLFQPFSTPQPAKTTNAEASQGGMFTAVQPKTSSGIFSQTFQPETNNAANLFNKPQSNFPSFAPRTTATSETPKATPAQKSSTKEASNPFSSLATPSTNKPNLFSASKDTVPASAVQAIPNLTAPSALPAGPELPKMPKVHVPKEWAVPGSVGVQSSSDSLFKQVSDLTAQLQVLNEKYRQQLASLPPTADWSSVSLWHHQHATDIKKKIDNAKKQRAIGKGITGSESTLSTKRKINEDSPEVRDPSPSKRARAAEFTASPTPQPSAPTPQINPPATATSSMFANAIGNKPSTPATPSSSSTSLFAPKTIEKPIAEPAKPAASFGFTPTASTTNGTGVAHPAASSVFKPSFGGDSTSTSSSTGFKPSFGAAPTAGSGGFFSQFSKTAKTYEQLAAERKKKAMDEDYDSDEETKSQWSARYDKAEAQRRAEEKKKIADTPKFEIPGASKPVEAAKPAEAAKTADQPSGSTSPKTNPFAGLMKANVASGASTPGLFTPKAASPAPSTGSQSVFDAPSASQTPSNNIFGHLTSGPSSTGQDESDEDDNEQQEPVGSVEPATPKRKFDESETEFEDTQDESRYKKQEASARGSLLSRMTKDNDSESEQEDSSTAQTNGTTTPANKPFAFFDFGAAGSKTAPPKTDTFVGDQTFKAGTPIKFGAAPATEKKDGAPKFSFTAPKNDTAPKFSFQPATPAASEFSTTPAKPPPFSLFTTASGGSSLFAPSGANSVTSSVFSSRAGTPLSEAGEISAQSAAEDDGEEKHEQIDLAKLTPEETSAYDIVFHTEVCLAKHQVDNGGNKTWANLAKGPIWILKDKETGKCFVRVKIASGATPLNYQILPSLPATVTGASRKMVMATKPANGGGLQSVLFAVKSSDVAELMAEKYTESKPE
jgi:hypothetical protein